ncbi:alpha/beta hydrolase [Cytophagaceae bacterium YF14B1]|uniref:Alpha/beta hydrolase n=1 Tax=Xanthocytophaga flava TaxID=3048013 RepID=A0AAE3QPW3_9BACT|nr:alpha/beta hydrolase [Xanthocytophaga flavus]MDJ1480548.1 alpha/beta hydrolase [Xanthocytophaga flavus]
MKWLKRIAKWTAGFIFLLTISYIVGPKPSDPILDTQLPSVTTDLSKLEQEINTIEKNTPYLKPDNQARIIWADSLHKQPTTYSFVYIHGFGASQAEGAPVHTDLARRYGANLYLARLQDHGISNKNTFQNLTPENYLASAKKALAIAKVLGHKVIILSTSAGAGLSLYLASEHPEITALIVYSPAIRLYDDKATLMNGPWGKQIMRSLLGSDYITYQRENPLEKKYWSTQYTIQGPIVLQSFMEAALNQDTFAKIKCPVYLAYYYKNEKEQDMVVSVPKMLEMFDQLGTSPSLKRKEAFPKTGHHVIASYIRSKDWKSVENGTTKFIEEVVHLSPK